MDHAGYMMFAGVNADVNVWEAKSHRALNGGPNQ
jgi:hypothetical protein